MKESELLSFGTDLDRPSAARIYDYLLGGFHNFEVDRRVAREFMQYLPDAPLYIRANRAFLRRVVRFLALDKNIEQFLDLGSGLPSIGNVPEVAQKANPSSRIVCVDIDPVAVRHSQEMLENNPNATAIQADLRKPEDVFTHPEVQRLLDLEKKPTAVLLLSSLLFVTDDEEAYALVSKLLGSLAAGSFIAISHPTEESLPNKQVRHAEQFYEEIDLPVKLRSRAQVERFFGGVELVEPGLVYAPLWHPESGDDLFIAQPERSAYYVGVGRKPKQGQQDQRPATH